MALPNPLLAPRDGVAPLVSATTRWHNRIGHPDERQLINQGQALLANAALTNREFNPNRNLNGRLTTRGQLEKEWSFLSINQT